MSRKILRAAVLVLALMLIITPARAVETDFYPGLPENVAAHLAEEAKNIVRSAKYMADGSELINDAAGDLSNVRIVGGWEQILWRGGGFSEAEEYTSVFDIRDTDHGVRYIFIVYVDGKPAMLFDICVRGEEVLIGDKIVSAKQAAVFEQNIEAVSRSGGRVYATNDIAAYSIGEDYEHMAHSKVRSGGRAVVFDAADFVQHFVERTIAYEKEMAEFKRENGYDADELIVGAGPDYSGFNPTNVVRGESTPFTFIIGGAVLFGALLFGRRKRDMDSM